MLSVVLKEKTTIGRSVRVTIIAICRHYLLHYLMVNHFHQAIYYSESLKRRASFLNYYSKGTVEGGVYWENLHIMFSRMVGTFSGPLAVTRI